MSRAINPERVLWLSNLKVGDKVMESSFGRPLCIGRVVRITKSWVFVLSDVLFGLTPRARYETRYRTRDGGEVTGVGVKHGTTSSIWPLTKQFEKAEQARRDVALDIAFDCVFASREVMMEVRKFIGKSKRKVFYKWNTPHER